MDYDVKELALSDKGELRIQWAARNMPVLLNIRERFAKEKPLNKARISACLHITTETANLALTLKAGGADVRFCASNPLSTQDDVAASLVANHNISMFCINGEDNQTYYTHINQALDHKPMITMDDGADLVSTLHSDRQDLIKNVIGGTEETTTGVIRLRSMAEDKVLKYPIIAVNDAYTKHLFDNRYGTGQSTLDGILRATNILFAGTNVVVSGYGWCGRGIAMRARGMGAKVIITEVKPIRALEAIMDGYQVMPMEKAAKIGDVFITVTGDKKIINRSHFINMRDGAILCNSGHFNVEIDIPALEELSESIRTVRPLVQEYKLKDGKKIYLLGEGRLINLAAAEGHPAVVMDMSFANQALTVEYLLKNGKSLDNRVYSVPTDIDEHVAQLKLKSMGVEIDVLSEEQERYLTSWKEGT
jgi:adenosylhomocysteinase